MENEDNSSTAESQQLHLNQSTEGKFLLTAYFYEDIHFMKLIRNATDHRPVQQAFAVRSAKRVCINTVWESPGVRGSTPSLNVLSALVALVYLSWGQM